MRSAAEEHIPEFAKNAQFPSLPCGFVSLVTIEGIGEITALTWALEVGDPTRFSSCAKVMSYCGLTSALRSSADKSQRGPISKQRNHWLQTALIEAAKLAPRWNPQLAALHTRELERGHRNRATLAGGSQTRLLSAGRGQERSAVSAPPAHQRCSRKQLKNCGCAFEFAGDLTAVSRIVGDWAREFLLPMLPSVCFGTGRFPLTQSSWTVLDYRSRKWMSGPAGARASRTDRRLQFTSFRTLREFLSEGKSPFSLDWYLSWMSPFFLVPVFPVPVFPPFSSRCVVGIVAELPHERTVDRVRVYWQDIN